MLLPDHVTLIYTKEKQLKCQQSVYGEEKTPPAGSETLVTSHPADTLLPFPKSYLAAETVNRSGKIWKAAVIVAGGWKC